MVSRESALDAPDVQLSRNIGGWNWSWNHQYNEHNGLGEVEYNNKSPGSHCIIEKSVSTSAKITVYPYSV